MHVDMKTKLNVICMQTRFPEQDNFFQIFYTIQKRPVFVVPETNKKYVVEEISSLELQVDYLGGELTFEMK